MNNTYTNIGTEIDGIWNYIAIVDNEAVLVDADNEILSTEPDFWYFTTEQLDEFESSTGFVLPQ